MYQNIYISKKENKVFIFDDKCGLIETEFEQYNYAYKISKNGKYKSLMGHNLEKIYNPPYGGYNLFESDVPATTRVLIDTYYESNQPSENHRILIFDIETDSSDGFSNINKADKEINAVSYYYNNIYYAFILDKKNEVSVSDTNEVKIQVFKNEKDLLKQFVKNWKEINPTIVSGWNCNNFDIPYLIKRLDVLFGNGASLKLSSIERISYNKHYNTYSIAGISCLDYMLLYKRYIGKNEPTYRLDYIGKKNVNLGKVEYSGSLNNLLKHDINKYIEYNINDVKIVKLLDDKFQFIELARMICHACHVPYEDFSISSKFLEGVVLTYLKNKNLISPNKPNSNNDEFSNDDDDDEKFDGAYVKEPVPGLYENVFSCDIQSLYPSIMMSLNISPETKVAQIINWDEIWNKDEICRNYNNIPEDFILNLKVGNEIYNYSKFDFIKFIQDNNLIISSHGTLFLSDKKGILPEILEDWFSKRIEYKNKAYEYKINNDFEKYSMYNRMQQVQKILLNSIYGCVGLSVWRYYDIDNAESVTSTGQDIIKFSGKLINNTLNKLYSSDNIDYVVYQDTDSAYIHLNKKTDINEVKTIAYDLSDKCNKFYNILLKKSFNSNYCRIKIIPESIYKSIFFIRKKRYAMIKCYSLESDKSIDDELEIKGLDVVRTSYPNSLRDLMKNVLVDILKNKDKFKIDEDIINFKNNINEISLSNIAKNGSVKELSKYDIKHRELFFYIKGTPAHVKAAIAYNDFLKKHKLDKKYTKILDGEKVKWVYLKQNEYNLDGISFRDYDDPSELIKFIEKYIDKNKIFESEFMNKVESFYQALKWDIPVFNKSVSNFFSF